MTSFSFSRVAPRSTPQVESEDAVISWVAEKAQAPVKVVRTFAKISAPENKQIFSVAAATKAFSRIKG